MTHYNQCGTCHVNPNGGGIVTKYGRGASNEFFPMGATENESQVAHGFSNLPNWFLLGADYRDVRFELEGIVKDEFVMQRQASVGVKIDRFTFAAEGGLYGKRQEFQRRAVFAKFDANDKLSLTLGNIKLPYGLTLADHTRLVKSRTGLGQGSEEIGGFLTLLTESFELFLGYGFGKTPGVFFDQGNRPTAVNSQDNAAVKAVWKATKRSRIGLSMGRSGQTFRMSFHVLASIGRRVYLQLETLRLQNPLFANNIVSSRTAWLPFNGLHVGLDFDLANDGFQFTDKYGGVFVRLIPRPHFEWEASTGFYQTRDGRALSKFNMVFHYWL